ncbi:MAG: GNAT family N-acetyltransferase [Chromatiales bacterium]
MQTQRLRSAPLAIECVPALASVTAAEWNGLVGADYPFLRHEFLAALETHDCLAPHGWTPAHLLARVGERLVGALPLYVKDNSYGEFVFDWSWAEAYERAGRRYYPKLVSALPFTPVTSPRVLLAQEAARGEVPAALIRAATEIMAQAGLSSLHCLFPPADEAQQLAAICNGLVRTGCQYHWHNQGYRDFTEFLAALDAKRRKQIRHERRDVRAAGIEIEVLSGREASEGHWRQYHEFYCSTFRRKWGEPRLTLPFFMALGQNLPDAVLLILARHRGRYVAGAFALRGTRTLYGRHWGCSGFFRHLHFEVCYYRAIEYCIAHGLERLDAGAQGEHKIARGFLPVRTWSVHWLLDSAFRRAVADFLLRERAAVDRLASELSEHAPYRREQGLPA